MVYGLNFMVCLALRQAIGLCIGTQIPKISGQRALLVRSVAATWGFEAHGEDLHGAWRPERARWSKALFLLCWPLVSRAIAGGVALQKRRIYLVYDP